MFMFIFKFIMFQDIDKQGLKGLLATRGQTWWPYVFTVGEEIKPMTSESSLSLWVLLDYCLPTKITENTIIYCSCSAVMVGPSILNLQGRCPKNNG